MELIKEPLRLNQPDFSLDCERKNLFETFIKDNV